MDNAMSTIEVRVVKIVVDILDVRSKESRGDSSFTDDLALTHSTWWNWS